MFSAAKAASPAVAEAAVAAAVDSLGARPDILVHAAGVAINAPLASMPQDALEEVIDINLTSAARYARSVVRSALRQRPSRRTDIVLIGSVVGAGLASRGQTAYAASKAGLRGLSASLALEMAPRDFRVNVVEPGYIKTPLTDSLPADRVEAIKAEVPLGSFGTVDDVVHGVIYLLTSNYTTGSVLTIDGGLTL